jgi:ADP-ribosylglycohydrolase
MLGAIIGDIVGSRFEFRNTSSYDFELFTSECSFTDDTICTVAVADAILKSEQEKSIDYKSALLDWGRRYPSPMGAYGTSFNTWLHSASSQPYNSFGNGAAMRISPVALALSAVKSYNESNIIREAMRCASVTHNHPEGIIGAVVTALMIHSFAIFNESDAVQHCERLMQQFYGCDWESNIPSCGVFDETCQGCVPLAFSIIRESSSFVDAVRCAVAYGGDSDTVGAIVGSIAESRFGIDDELVRCALSYLPNEMIEVINKFYSIWQQRKI